MPGFASAIYAAGDPRADALLAFCGQALAEDPAFQRLRRSLDLVFEIFGLRPGFALASVFVEMKLGLDSRRGGLGLSSSEAP